MSKRESRDAVSISTEGDRVSYWLTLDVDPTHPRTYFRYMSEESMRTEDGETIESDSVGSCEVSIHNSDIVRDMGERLLAIADHMQEQND